MLRTGKVQKMIFFAALIKLAVSSDEPTTTYQGLFIAVKDSQGIVLVQIETISWRILSISIN